jgi:hypothetical protein
MPLIVTDSFDCIHQWESVKSVSFFLTHMGTDACDYSSVGICAISVYFF